ncbi:ankyrin repeat, PH and SEC7 domain containing protein secG-like [Ptychodera flava]|uniref:ankyrin repeat, PH and SEC7 domain containing protein secG-like n=1 Tax=Ptychodera flava TaxID=63121 RepID=UPI00396A71A6
MAECLKKVDPMSMKRGMTFLHHVAMSNKYKLIAPLYALCNYGELLQVRAGDESQFTGMTPIEVAEKMKNRSVLQKLKIHKMFEDSLSELHIAARDGDVQKVEELCQGEYLYKVDVRGLYGNTALYTACVSGKLDVAKQLIKYGANQRQRNDWGDTILHRSARWGQTEILRYLLENDPYLDINTMNYDGCTALHMAALYGSLPAVQLLLEYDAYPRARNNNGRTPLDYAHEEGHHQISLALQNV